VIQPDHDPLSITPSPRLYGVAGENFALKMHRL